MTKSDRNRRTNLCETEH